MKQFISHTCTRCIAHLVVPLRYYNSLQRCNKYVLRCAVNNVNNNISHRTFSNVSIDEHKIKHKYMQRLRNYVQHAPKQPLMKLKLSDIPTVLTQHQLQLQIPTDLQTICNALLLYLQYNSNKYTTAAYRTLSAQINVLPLLKMVNEVAEKLPIESQEQLEQNAAISNTEELKSVNTVTLQDSNKKYIFLRSHVRKLYNHIIDILCLLQQHDLALTVIQVMSQYDVYPNAYSYEPLLKSSATVHDALELFENVLHGTQYHPAIQPHAIHYTALLQQCKQRNYYELALKIFNSMLEHNVTPNERIWNLIFQILGDAKDYNALQLLQTRIRALNIELTARNYAVLINVYLTMKQPSDAYTILVEADRTFKRAYITIDTYEQLITQLSDINKYQRILQVYNRLRPLYTPQNNVNLRDRHKQATNGTVRHRTVVVLLHALAKHHRYTDIVTMYNECIKQAQKYQRTLPKQLYREFYHTFQSSEHYKRSSEKVYNDMLAQYDKAAVDAILNQQTTDDVDKFTGEHTTTNTRVNTASKVGSSNDTFKSVADQTAEVSKATLQQSRAVALQQANNTATTATRSSTVDAADNNVDLHKQSDTHDTNNQQREQQVIEQYRQLLLQPQQSDKYMLVVLFVAVATALLGGVAMLYATQKEAYREQHSDNETKQS